jgi:hypothetical protein
MCAGNAIWYLLIRHEDVRAGLKRFSHQGVCTRYCPGYNGGRALRDARHRAVRRMLSQMMSGMMQNMMAQMGEGGCDPAEM